MTIQLNGAPCDVIRATTVAALLDELQLPRLALLIEHNGLALLRDEWPSAQLADGDRIEVLRVVAGG